MSWMWKKAAEPSAEELEAMDPVLQQALGEFRASVQAWSEAELARPRAVHAAGHRLGRLALGWSLAGVLLAGGVSAGVMVAHQRQQSAANRPVEVVVHPQAQAATPAGTKVVGLKDERTAGVEEAAVQARQDEPVLANVDSAVSRTVPSAMDPLVDLGNESGGVN